MDDDGVVRLEQPPPVLIPRADWFAVPPLSTRSLPHPVPNVVFSYWPGVDKCITPIDCLYTVRTLQKWHMQAGMPDIAYNFLVGGLGDIYEGRGWHTCPEKLDEFPQIDGKSINICFIGYFRRSEHYKPLLLDIISRAEWGALPPISQEPLEHPVENVIFSYLPGEQWCPDEQGCINTLKQLQKIQMDEGMPDIIYNFMVGRRGHLYEGRGWNVKPQKIDELPSKIDGNSVNICFVGNKKSKQPTEEQWAPVFQLIRYAVKYKYLEEQYSLHETRSAIK